MLSVKSVFRHARPRKEVLYECEAVEYISKGSTRPDSRPVTSEALHEMGLRPGLVLRGWKGENCELYLTHGEHYVMNSNGQTIAKYDLGFDAADCEHLMDPEFAAQPKQCAGANP